MPWRMFTTAQHRDADPNDHDYCNGGTDRAEGAHPLQPLDSSVEMARAERVSAREGETVGARSETSLIQESMSISHWISPNSKVAP